MNPEIAYSTGAMALIGLMGAGHCAAMCGGIVAALGFSANQGTVGANGSGPQKSRWPLLFSYNLGRIASYGLAGAIVGWMGQLGTDYLSMGPVLRSLAGTLLILMGCYLAGWWKILTRLETVGASMWKRLQPFASGLFQVRNPAKGFVYGMIWGWLPCGLVYSALAYAATSASVLEGFMAMTAFGVGTMPAMLLGGFFAQKLRALLQRKLLRWPMALALILFGIWTFGIVQAMDHSQHIDHGKATGEEPHSMVEGHLHDHPAADQDVN